MIRKYTHMAGWRRLHPKSQISPLHLPSRRDRTAEIPFSCPARPAFYKFSVRFLPPCSPELRSPLCLRFRSHQRILPKLLQLPPISAVQQCIFGPFRTQTFHCPHSAGRSIRYARFSIEHGHATIAQVVFELERSDGNAIKNIAGILLGQVASVLYAGSIRYGWEQHRFRAGRRAR